MPKNFDPESCADASSAQSSTAASEDSKATERVAEHMIDCDAAPFIPDGWTIVEHQKSGLWKWDPSQVTLYLSTLQRQGKLISGNSLRQKLKHKLVLSACVLDHLFAHPELIPEDWKRRYVFFYGTTYCDHDGRPCVRFLGWNSDRWQWSRSLDSVWSAHDPAALRVSRMARNPGIRK